MKFMTMRELRLKTAELRKDLSADEEVVLTANGKPVGLLTAIDAGNLEAELIAVRRARARSALDRIRASARGEGKDLMAADHVDELVARSRKERSSGKKRRRK